MEDGTGFERISGEEVQGSIRMGSLGLGFTTVLNSGTMRNRNNKVIAIRYYLMSVKWCCNIHIMVGLGKGRRNRMLHSHITINGGRSPGIMGKNTQTCQQAQMDSMHELHIVLHRGNIRR